MPVWEAVRYPGWKAVGSSWGKLNCPEVCVYDPWGHRQSVTVLSLVSQWAALECRRALGAGPSCWSITDNAVKPHQSPLCHLCLSEPWCVHVPHWQRPCHRCHPNGRPCKVGGPGGIPGTSPCCPGAVGGSEFVGFILWAGTLSLQTVPLSLPSALLIFQLRFMAAVKKIIFFWSLIFLTFF